MTTDTHPRRGRPRPRETIRRDEQVFALLTAAPGPVNRRVLVAELGWEGKTVYAAIMRLRRAGLVEKVNGNNYQPVTERNGDAATGTDAENRE